MMIIGEKLYMYICVCSDITDFQRRLGDQIWDMKKRWGNNNVCLGNGEIQV